MKNRTLYVMQRIATDKNIVAKFLRIQRSIAAFPILAVYFIAGSYFTKFNIFQMKFLLGGLVLYLLSVAVNGYNNVFDVEEDKIAITRGITKANYLLKEFTLNQVKWNFALTSIVLASIVVIIGDIEFAGLCAFTFFLGIIYTRPIRLKNRPPIGTLSNTYGFSILPVLSCYFLLDGDLTAAIAFIVVIYLPTFGSCLIAEIADREVDRQIGTRTTACWLGQHVRTVLKAVLICSFVLFFIGIYINWAVILVIPFVAAILYETYRLYLDFSDSKADYALIKIGAHLSRGLIIYVVAVIILYLIAPDLLTSIFYN